MEEVGKYMWSEEGEFMAQFFANCNTRDHHHVATMACKEPSAATSWFDGAGMMYHEVNNVLVPMAFPDHNAADDSINSLLNMNDFMGMDYCSMENSTTTTTTHDHVSDQEDYCNMTIPDHDHDHDHVGESTKNKKKKRSRIPAGDHIPPPVPRNSRRGGLKRTKVEEDDDKDNILNNAALCACSDQDGDSMTCSETTTQKTQRAGRGSATDPQSLYARKRRERINERLKILQKLIPNGTKVDISTMLEEAVEYVKFLQLQIKLLSSDDHWMFAPIAYNGMDIGALDHFKTQSALKLQS